MSSPGAGKTTLLERIAEHLKPKYKMAVIEGDCISIVQAFDGPSISPLLLNIC